MKLDYAGPNGRCTCGSGKKYKKCCGPRGGLNEIEYAEEQAHEEEYTRQRIQRAKSGLHKRGTRPPALTFLAMSAIAGMDPRG